MATSDFWHKLFVHRKKVVLSVIFTLLSLFTNAQDASFNKQKKWVDRNLPYYDDRLLHYGFTLAVNSTRFRPQLSDNYFSKDSITSITAPRATGFTLGFILDLKMGAYFNLRLLPTVSFYQRDVKFKYAGSTESVQTTESTFIELPLLCKFKSERHGNSRVYLVGGLKPAIEAGAKKKEKKESDLRTSNLDLSIDYGFGFDIYYPLFKFSPEIRFSHGLLDMVNNDQNLYRLNLKKLSSHTVTIFLHFE